MSNVRSGATRIMKQSIPCANKKIEDYMSVGATWMEFRVESGKS